jgi:predicted PurR-regulated permease PerM
MFLNIDKPFTVDRIVRIIITLSIIIGLVLFIRYLSDILIPFAIAVMLAYIFNPVVYLVQKLIKPRAPAVIITLILIAIIVTGLGFLIIPLMYKELVHLGELLTNLVNSSAAKEEGSFAHSIWAFIMQFIDVKHIQSLFSQEQLYSIGKSLLEKMLPGIWGVIQGTVSFISGIFMITIVFMYMIFLLIGFDKYRAGWKKLIPINYRDNVFDFVNEFKYIMNKYFRGQAIIALIQGIIFGIAFSIVGIPMSIFLGIFLAFLNMIPYMQFLGAIPAFLFAIVHALDTGQNIWTTMIIVSAIFLITQAIQDYILTPKILGKVTGLNPVLIILSIFTWSKIFGFLGLIIALPLTYLILSYYRRMLVAYNKQYLHEHRKEMHHHDSE